MRKSTAHVFFILSNCTPSLYFATLLQTLMTILFSPIHRHIMRCSTACIDISMNDSKVVYKEVIKCFQLFTTVSPINNQLYTSLYSLKIWVRIKCQDRCAPMKWENRRNGTAWSEPETGTDDTETGNRDLGTNCLLLHHYHYNSLISSVYLTNTTIWVPLQLIILYIIITWGDTLRVHLFFQIQ